MIKEKAKVTQFANWKRNNWFFHKQGENKGQKSHNLQTGKEIIGFSTSKAKIKGKSHTICKLEKEKKK